jgi:hypothetical protein
MKKLEGKQAEVIMGILNDGETLFELEGKRYEISIIPDKVFSSTTIEEDIENDSELMDILLQAKKDIQNKNYYSSEEMREMIRRGEV